MIGLLDDARGLATDDHCLGSYQSARAGPTKAVSKAPKLTRFHESIDDQTFLANAAICSCFGTHRAWVSSPTSVFSPKTRSAWEVRCEGLLPYVAHKVLYQLSTIFEINRYSARGHHSRNNPPHSHKHELRGCRISF